MAVVWIPAQLRALTGGRATIVASGSTVGEVVQALDRLYPGIRDRLCEADNLRPGLTVAIDNRIAPLGLREAVAETSEVHFLPAIGGGEAGGTL
jgi:molybdopterin synthase sulfur carrier subunit